MPRGESRLPADYKKYVDSITEELVSQHGNTSWKISERDPNEPCRGEH